MEEIKDLQGKLKHIDQKNDKKYNRLETKADETQKKLKLEEKERSYFGVKLEQVMINNKKLSLQKRFLEKQLEKDLREIQAEMTKIQIDI